MGSSVHADFSTFIRFVIPTEDFYQGRFPSTILTNQAVYFAFFKL